MNRVQSNALIGILALLLSDSSDTTTEDEELALFHQYLPGYNLPANKQGIADRNNNLLLEDRYQVFKNDMTIGIQKYNYYWQSAEDSVPSTASPQSCTDDYMLFPENEDQKNALGLHSYHCYKKSFLSNWEERFIQNTNHNIQVALVLWTAPQMYRDEGCEGFYFPSQDRYLKEGCYPTSSHYIDYEDWIRFTAYKFGKYVDHYIVWNEADSTNWADSSTTEFSKETMQNDIDFHKNRSFGIYTSLLKKTIIAVNELDKTSMGYEGECKNLVYVSLDRGWYSRTPSIDVREDGDIRIRWQNMNLLDYIWSELGLEYDWAITIHPYGGVYEESGNSLRFSTLKNLSFYQKERINMRKVQDNSWLSYPQSRLFASEQNVDEPNTWEAKGQFICESYAVAMQMPALIGITHNHFQDNIYTDSESSTHHTMLPSTVKSDLSDADQYDTFLAYLSTSVFVWNQRDDHFCCTMHGIGCMSQEANTTLDSTGEH